MNAIIEINFESKKLLMSIYLFDNKPHSLVVNKPHSLVENKPPRWLPQSIFEMHVIFSDKVIQTIVDADSKKEQIYANKRILAVNKHSLW